MGLLRNERVQGDEDYTHQSIENLNDPPQRNKVKILIQLNTEGVEYQAECVQKILVQHNAKKQTPT